MRRLTRNAAQCGRCGEIVESKHRHDWRQCKCGGIFVDGGLSYVRFGYESGVSYEDLSEYAEDEELSFDGREQDCAA